MEINSTIDNFKIDQFQLKFGKCLLMHQNDQLEILTKFFNVPFCHPPDCQLENIYYNKSDSEVKEVEDKFEEMVKNKSRKIKFASVGIVVDKNVF
jgi:hypothetical protein